MHVLIAEDNPAEARLILEGLAEAGIQVTTNLAENGPDAQKHLGLMKYDLVLLDVNLPKMSGLEALESFGGEPPSPVVVLSASAWPEDRVRALRAGALAYYRKPTDLDQFFEIIGEIGRIAAAGLGSSVRSPYH